MSQNNMTVVAKFEIPYFQYLDENGIPTQSLPEFAKNSEELIKLYRVMMLMRVFDNKAVALQRTGKIGTYAGILGQEAVSVAIGNVMQKDDVFFPNYREYGTYYQRGVKLSEILAYWGGDERGSNFAHNAVDFPICVPIASQCLHAAGAACAFKLRKQKRVAVTVLGDGGTSKGDFYEAMNLAGDWNLPVVFVINNNGWAISVPRSKQTHAKTLAQKAIAAGFEGVQVDGNDAIAMKAEFEKAMEKARKGLGPTLIEAITYRLCDHTTADDAKRYRSQEELDEATRKEPLIRLRKYLMSQNWWSENDEEKLKNECMQEVEKAVEEYYNLSEPAPESMFDFVYEKLPDALVEQRNELLENLT